MKNEKAFCRTDAIALIVACAGLSMVLTSVLGNAPSAASDAALCANRLRNLTTAWQMFAVDHGGLLPTTTGEREWSGYGGADNSGGGGAPGWLDLPINHEGEINPELTTAHSPLMPYVSGGAQQYQCPSDPSRGSWEGFNGGRETPRVRSYAMNGWIGGSGWGNSGPGWRVFEKMDDIVDPSPSDAFVFIGERADSINDGYFIVDMNGHPDNPRSFWIVDYPSAYHAGGASISFADGHVELKQWKDPLTTPPYQPGGLVLNVVSPGNPDIAWLQERSTSRNPR